MKIKRRVRGASQGISSPFRVIDVTIGSAWTLLGLLSIGLWQRWTLNIGNCLIYLIKYDTTSYSSFSVKRKSIVHSYYSCVVHPFKTWLLSFEVSFAEQICDETSSGWHPSLRSMSHSALAWCQHRHLVVRGILRERWVPVFRVARVFRFSRLLI